EHDRHRQPGAQRAHDREGHQGPVVPHHPSRHAREAKAARDTPFFLVHRGQSSLRSSVSNRMHVLTHVDPDEIKALKERDEFFWIDLTGPDDAAVDQLGELLDLHPVALEDTREFGQRPKLDPYGHHLLLVFYTARATGDDTWPAEPIEVHVYLSGGFM